MAKKLELTAVLFFSALLSIAAPGFETDIRPLLTEFCLDCHDTATQKGELDLERFASLADISKALAVWEQVQQQIAHGEMPPKKEPQFSTAQHARFTSWLTGTLNEIALASAGDPGPVVLRRLSNHEYRYSIRDLTGVVSLDPGREFPGDSAAGEGFTNVGAALVMSPGLLTKYLDAGKDVAAHAVLLPHGIAFSPSTSRADWTQERLDAIRALYDRYTVPGAETAQNLQGVRFSTVDGGVIPLARYLQALRGGDATGLSQKYLAMLAPADSLLLGPIRELQDPAPVIAWQQALWRFAKVGHIGKRGGPTAWQEPQDPLARTEDIRLKIPASQQDLVLYLSAGDAGDGAEDDRLLWKDATLRIPDQEPIPISGIAAFGEQMEALQSSELARSAAYLDACSGKDQPDLNPTLLDAWRDLLGLRPQDRVPRGHLVGKKVKVAGYEAVRGWGGDLPILLVNQSAGDLAITTLTVPARGVTVHPLPQEDVSVVWRSPIAGKVRIEGLVADADTVCGNGAAWSLERIAVSSRSVLAGEHFPNGGRSSIALESVALEQGDLLRLNVTAHDRNHTCDTTQLTLTIVHGEQRWDLEDEIVDRIHEGNPMADRLGNPEVWHFCSSAAESAKTSQIPADSALARWQAGQGSTEAVQRAILSPETNADRSLRQLLQAWRGVLPWLKLLPNPKGESAEIAQQAPATLAIRLPASLLAKGAEFAARAEIEQGSVQAFVSLSKPDSLALRPGRILLPDQSPARERFLAEFATFRSLFPAALCYRKIVPVDEVVTLTLRYREDHELRRLMLDDEEAAVLDRLWDELYVVSRQPLQQLHAYNQLWQYSTQDSDPSALDPMRAGFVKAAADFKQRLIDLEPTHLQAALDFAGRAWRRPLSDAKNEELRALYRELRESELPHEAAIRQLLARILLAPAFLYRGETAAPGPDAAPVSDWELATRMSYFLWSSTPDDELRQLPRMLKDPRIRRLASEFGAQWLHVRNIATLDEKSERHFPSFRDLRDDMQEETLRLFMDLFQEDRSILSLLDADHSFLSRSLAAHYSIDAPAVDWQRVEGMRARGRGGILGLASTLARHSGASRTSPILRGNWVSEVLLGEKLPRPPKDVPVLPDEPPEGLSERQLIERHSSDPACARCHARIDPFGFALEGFDAIGRARDADSATVLADGTALAGIDGLRTYLRDTRREDFLRQFCRKLLGYALGRSVQLSDKPLIDEILAALAANDYRVGIAFDLIVRSPQFTHVRGQDAKP